jgi:hypothetical protein
VPWWSCRAWRAVQIGKVQPDPFNIGGCAALQIGLVDGDEDPRARAVHRAKPVPVLIERTVANAGQLLGLAVLVVVERLEGETGGSRIQ